MVHPWRQWVRGTEDIALDECKFFFFKIWSLSYWIRASTAVNALPSSFQNGKPFSFYILHFLIRLAFLRSRSFKSFNCQRSSKRTERNGQSFELRWNLEKEARWTVRIKTLKGYLKCICECKPNLPIGEFQSNLKRRFLKGGPPALGLSK